MNKQVLTEAEKKNVIDLARMKGEFYLFKCQRGILGRATGGHKHKDGRIVLTGFQEKDPARLWQSVTPVRAS